MKSHTADKQTNRTTRPQLFTGLRDVEDAFAEFEQAGGHPGISPDTDVMWGRIASSKRLDYAKRLNDFAPLLPEGKFPPADQFLLLCALHVYGNGAFELWHSLREHYSRGKPRGSHKDADAALDVCTLWMHRCNRGSTARYHARYPERTVRLSGSIALEVPIQLHTCE